MKLTKKIAAIMFAFMMVFSLSTNAKATSGSKEDDGSNGKITINKTIDGQTYKIYKIFDLESFNADPGKEAYSYTVATGWENFFNGGAGNDYVDVNNGYVTWKKGVNLEKAAELSKKALEYANKNKATISATRETKASGTSVTFDKLDYGYYLVDSSLGALCGLTTTNPVVTISEKNDLPTLTKNIEIKGHEYDENTANIGDTISFNIHVSIPKGTDKCILTDEMEGLEFTGSPHTNDGSAYVLDVVPVGGVKSGEDYIFTKTAKGFTIEFTKKYLDSINDNDPRSVFITYNAKLKNTAAMGNDGTANTNKAWLTYGDQNTESTPVTTRTYTYQFPVLKYTGSIDNPTYLSGAEFKLYSDYSCKHEIKLADAGQNIYRYFITGNDIEANIVTDSTGKFTIQGLAEGTYYLKETKAPHGYNKLENPITVELQKQPDGANFMLILQDGRQTDTINALNNSGSILPSTGGMGTTLIYLIGGALVLGSGFVLANKKRAKAK